MQFILLLSEFHMNNLNILSPLSQMTHHDMELSADWVDSLLCLLESCTANVPSSTYTGESPDISLYDHLKICLLYTSRCV